MKGSKVSGKDVTSNEPGLTQGELPSKERTVESDFTTTMVIDHRSCEVLLRPLEKHHNMPEMTTDPSDRWTTARTSQHI
jgi:hypothetical protein